jgi:hypothetical protein
MREQAAKRLPVRAFGDGRDPGSEFFGQRLATGAVGSG